MSGEVLAFRRKNYVGDPDAVLTDSLQRFETVLVLGLTKDGSFEAVSSEARGPEVLWLLETLKTDLMAGNLMAGSK